MHKAFHICIEYLLAIVLGVVNTFEKQLRTVQSQKLVLKLRVVLGIYNTTLLLLNSSCHGMKAQSPDYLNLL